MSVGLLFDFHINKWGYDCAGEALILTWPYHGITRLLVFLKSKILALKQCCSTKLKPEYCIRKKQWKEIIDL